MSIPADGEWIDPTPRTTEHKEIVSQPTLDRKGTGCPVPLREGRWQCASRRGELWLRYLGE